VPIAGWGARLARGWWKRLEKRAELLEALAEGMTLMHDRARFESEYMVGHAGDVYRWLEGPARHKWLSRGAEGLSPRDQYDELRVRLRESRKRTWRARGFPELEADLDHEVTEQEREAHAEYVRTLREFRQTKRWQVAEAPPPKPPNGDGRKAAEPPEDERAPGGKAGGDE
jgi:hypothetical protein